MRCVWWVLLVGCAGPGAQHDFQPDVYPDGPPLTDDLPPNAPNGAFVSSRTFLPGELGGIAGANAACQDMAQQANIGGTYRAWLSDSTTDAITQLAGARGWVRPDSRPVADTVEDIVAGNLRYPLTLNEYGHVGGGIVVTGTAPVWATGRAAEIGRA